MKVRDLELEKEVMINGFVYNYKGIQKVFFMNVGRVQKHVFERNTGNGYDYKYFDLSVGNKDLKEVNGQLEMK